jgi:hypothetical protein
MTEKYKRGPGNWCETHLKLTAKQEGFELLRNGWPDFLLVRGEEVVFVEVKPKGQQLSDAQLKVLTVLDRLGLKVRIAVNGELTNLMTLTDFQVMTKNMTGTSRFKSQPRGIEEAKEKVLQIRNKVS